jgi:hypothetical protein
MKYAILCVMAIGLGVVVLLSAQAASQPGLPRYVIQGVFVVSKTGQDGTQPKAALSAWVFRADGHITDYVFVSPTAVRLADGSYRIGKRLDDERYEVIIDTDTDPQGGSAGVMKIMTDAGDKKPKGFIFTTKAYELQFLSTKATEFKSMLDGVKGTIDFRKNKNNDWRVVDINSPSILGTLNR